MGKTLKEIFEIEKSIRQEDDYSYMLNDYEVFKDKDLLEELRVKIIQNIIDNKIPNTKLLKEYIDEEINKSIEGYDLTQLERNHIYNLIDNEINGYGPITELLKDKSVSEIMVNGANDIYVEIDGKIEKDESISFINDEHILRTIQRMVQPLGKSIDIANPMIDSRLSDGSRLNAIIPPLSLKGPTLTIRKFKENIENIDNLVASGTLTPYMADFLEAAVEAKLNILVCGGAGSGKTTLLNILSSFIGEKERIITIEDAAELRLKQKHVVSLETRESNYKNDKAITMHDLVINSLRMRPDRIIVGEVRGKEAFDMLQAMNTGHEGSMTTLHANGPVDALNRLETMVLMGNMQLPIKAIREYIASAINLVVHTQRLSDGKRKVTSICEIVGLKDEEIILKEIFAFEQQGLTENMEVIGEFTLNDYVPKVYEYIKKCGITSLDEMFKKSKK